MRGRGEVADLLYDAIDGFVAAICCWKWKSCRLKDATSCRFARYEAQEAQFSRRKSCYVEKEKFKFKSRLLVICTNPKRRSRSQLPLAEISRTSTSMSSAAQSHQQQAIAHLQNFIASLLRRHNGRKEEARSSRRGRASCSTLVLLL